MGNVSGDFASSLRSLSFLPALSAAVDPDPHQSRNTVAIAQQAYQRGFLRGLEEREKAGEGAVFTVSCYEDTKSGSLFAVKKLKSLCGAPGSRTTKASGDIYLAFKEIQIISHSLLCEHVNIVNIIGWDWLSSHGIGEPAIIVEYSELGTLQDFLKQHASSISSNTRQRICLDVACGLSALHAADVAHGDVKINNVLMFHDHKGEYLAKLSDFSHAIFGLSHQRRTTYPGSSLYNAPEVRQANALLSTEKLKLCESFSYGLLVWEVLRDGSPFFHDQSLATYFRHALQDDMQMSSVDEQILDILSRYDLLTFACEALTHCRCISSSQSPLYHQIFEWTLQRHPARRKDLGTIATRLDEFDETNGAICHDMCGSRLAPFASWNFDPWKTLTWQEKFVTLRDQEASISASSEESQYTEMILMISRCYAEGFGCGVDKNKSVSLLLEAVSNKCHDATGILELGWDYISEWLDIDEAVMSSTNVVSSTLKDIKVELGLDKQIRPSFLKTRSYRTLADEDANNFSRMLKMWMTKNQQRTSSLPFQCHLTSAENPLTWTPVDVDRLIRLVQAVGCDLCDTRITYNSIVQHTVTATFFEACARNGMIFALQLGLKQLEHTDISSTSWGSFESLWEVLLIESTKAGHRQTVEFLIDILESQLLPIRADKLRWNNPAGESPLHFLAFLQGTQEMIENLVQKFMKLGCPPNKPLKSKTWLSPFGLEIRGTPLQMAVKCGCLRTVKALRSYGASITERGGLHHDALELACALQFSDITRTLLDSLPAHKRNYDRLLRALVAPTLRGWFDRLPILSTNSVTTRIQRMLDLIGHVYSEEASRDANRTWSAWLQQTNGSIIVEAISKGQRDPEFMLSLLECGLAHCDHHGRLMVLSAISTLSPSDPNRDLLLRAMLGFAAIPLLGPRRKMYEDWRAGWFPFFYQYRHNEVGGTSNRTMLHLWAESADEQLFGLVNELWPTVIATMAKIPDSNGYLPIDKALLRGCVLIYNDLKKYSPHNVSRGTHTIKSLYYEPTTTNSVLHFLRAEELRHTEMEHMVAIGRIITDHVGSNNKGECGRGDFLTSIEEMQPSQAKLLAQSLSLWSNWLLQHHPTRVMQIESVCMTEMLCRIQTQTKFAILDSIGPLCLTNVTDQEGKLRREIVSGLVDIFNDQDDCDLQGFVPAFLMDQISDDNLPLPKDGTNAATPKADTLIPYHLIDALISEKRAEKERLQQQQQRQSKRAGVSLKAERNIAGGYGTMDHKITVKIQPPEDNTSCVDESTRSIRPLRVTGPDLKPHRTLIERFIKIRLKPTRSSRHDICEGKRPVIIEKGATSAVVEAPIATTTSIIPNATAATIIDMILALPPQSSDAAAVAMASTTMAATINMNTPDKISSSSSTSAFPPSSHPLPTKDRDHQSHRFNDLIIARLLYRFLATESLPPSWIHDQHHSQLPRARLGSAGVLNWCSNLTVKINRDKRVEKLVRWNGNVWMIDGLHPIYADSSRGNKCLMGKEEEPR